MVSGSPSSSPRTLIAYLALPRPGDLTKAIILPLGFLLAAAATSWPSLRELARAGVVWFAVEYLAYQARYQWNDIRGFASDQAHPDRDRRGRLPGPPDKGRAHIAASAAVLWARIGAAVALVAVLPGLHLAPVLLPAVGAVFAAALVYETVRRRAAGCPSAERPDGAVVALWFVSGAGYCVRGVTGIALGAATGMSLPVAVLAGLTCWLSGIVFVTTRWAVESIPFARRAGDQLVWRAEREHGRGHLLPLTRWIPQDGRSAPPDLEHWRPLWCRCVWHAPWNLAYAAALPLAWLAGAGLVDGRLPSVGEILLMGIVLAGVWTVSVRRPHVGTAAICVGALVAAAAATDAGAAGALPPITLCLLYLICVHQCLADVGASMKRLRAAARATVSAVSAPSPSAVQTPAGPASTRRTAASR